MRLKLTGDVLESIDGSELVEVLTLELELANGGDGLRGKSLRSGSDEGSLGVGKRNNGSSELDDLEGSVLETKGVTISLMIPHDVLPIVSLPGQRFQLQRWQQSFPGSLLHEQS